ncbi:MAG TPA: hydroxymyristoyl-ACP dehydratase [Geobacteraceae bacterium]|nr:hydroxymyristoyl-ACP dehydratase [Geobacteraceae bacterium]
MRSIFEEARLFDSNPRTYLPHTNPFLYIDRILSLESGSGAEGLKVVTHDPAGYPPVFLIESMAQLAGIAAAREEGEGGFLASIDHAEFSGGVCEGDRIIVSIRIVKSFGRLHLCEGEAVVEGKQVASAKLTLGVGKL